MDYKMALSSARIQTIMQQKMEIEHFPSSVILSFFFYHFWHYAAWSDHQIPSYVFLRALQVKL